MSASEQAAIKQSKKAAFRTALKVLLNKIERVEKKNTKHSSNNTEQKSTAIGLSENFAAHCSSNDGKS